MLAQCRRESAALKVIAASKVVVVVVEAAALSGSKRTGQLAKLKRSH